MARTSIRLTVPPSAHGDRLDVALARLAPEMSRRSARRLIDQGSVYVGGKRTRVSSRSVDAGDEITVAVDEGAPAPTARDAAPWILALERDFVVVDKPAGVPTEPTRAAAVGALVVELKRALQARGEDVSFLAAAHRLDVDTTGLVVLARTRAAAAALAEQLRERRVERRYLALVGGAPSFTERDVDAPLSRTVDRSGRVRVDPDGLASLTKLAVVGGGARATLLVAEAVTGRTHQIRAHLAHLGHPLVGDARYGGSSAEHLGLHAAALAFDRPAPSGEGRQGRARFVAPPPPAFRAAARAAGLADDVVDAAAARLSESP